MLEVIGDDAGELGPIRVQPPPDGLGLGQRSPLTVGQQQPNLVLLGVIEEEGELLVTRDLLGAHETQVDALFTELAIGGPDPLGIGPRQLLQTAGNAPTSIISGRAARE